MPMKGKDRHLKRLRKLSGENIVRAANRVVVVGADMIRAKAFVEISRGSVSGKQYEPSKPGEYPNRDTGVLQANFETTNPRPLEAVFSSNAPYAVPLEFKPPSQGGRPHVRPARESEEPKIRRLFGQEIGRIVKRSGS